MHEISVARNVALIASDKARESGFNSVKSVRVLIGAWTCINPELLRRAFEAACEGTQAYGAKLEVEVVDPACVCENCGAEFNPGDFSLECNSCGSRRVVLCRGWEMVVDSIEV